MSTLLKTHSAEETKEIGFRLGKLVGAGTVVALEGDLGAGKTTFVKGMAKGLGVKEEAVSSPTFVLVHEYQGREKMFHLDWYRLGRVEGDDALMAEECFDSPAVTLVEWSNKATQLLPEEHILIRLEHQGEDKRSIRIQAKGTRYKALIEKLGS